MRILIKSNPTTQNWKEHMNLDWICFPTLPMMNSQPNIWLLPLNKDNNSEFNPQASHNQLTLNNLVMLIGKFWVKSHQLRIKAHVMQDMLFAVSVWLNQDFWWKTKALYCQNNKSLIAQQIIPLLDVAVVAEPVLWSSLEKKASCSNQATHTKEQKVNAKTSQEATRLISRS